MVLAYHLIFTAYGFWLPNDPRGSWSGFVRCWELYWYGDATKVTTTASLARRPHDQSLRRLQKTALRYDPVRFNAQQIVSVARGFARAIEESAYVVYACSILPEHVHLVVRRHHQNLSERIIGHLKARATQQLLAEGLHPFQNVKTPTGTVPPAWARRGWHVYLDDVDDIRRAIPYVEDNPTKQGAPRQRWPFVTPYGSEMANFDPNDLLV
jgi:REP element-mobilizing transposase RayT